MSCSDSVALGSLFWEMYCLLICEIGLHWLISRQQWVVNCIKPLQTASWCLHGQLTERHEVLLCRLVCTPSIICTWHRRRQSWFVVYIWIDFWHCFPHVVSAGGIIDCTSFAYTISDFLFGCFFLIRWQWARRGGWRFPRDICRRKRLIIWHSLLQLIAFIGWDIVAFGCRTNAPPMSAISILKPRIFTAGLVLA